MVAPSQEHEADYLGESSPNELLTLAAIRREYGLGLGFLRKETKSGALKSYWLGSWRRVRRSDFEAYLASKRASQ